MRTSEEEEGGPGASDRPVVRTSPRTERWGAHVGAAILLALVGTAYGYRPSTYPQHRLPLLVGILAILIGLVGALILIVGLLVLLAGLGIALSAHAPVYLTGAAGGAVLVGGFYFVLGMIMVATARGLWDLEAWALWVTGIVVFLLLLGSFLIASWVLFVLVLILFIYLIGVRRHFS